MNRSSHGPKRIRVHRKGYHRKGYERKAFTEHRDGHVIREPATHVSPTYVPPTSYLERDRGLPGHGPQSLPPMVHHERLTNLGYHASKSEEERHKALHEAVKRYGKKSVLGMLRWQISVRQTEQPEVRKKFESDFEYVS